MLSDSAISFLSMDSEELLYTVFVVYLRLVGVVGILSIIYCVIHFSVVYGVLRPYSAKVISPNPTPTGIGHSLSPFPSHAGVFSVNSSLEASTSTPVRFKASSPFSPRLSLSPVFGTTLDSAHSDNENQEHIPIPAFSQQNQESSFYTHFNNSSQFLRRDSFAE